MMKNFFIPSNTTMNGLAKTFLDIPLKSLSINGFLPEKLIKYNLVEKLPEGFTNKIILAGFAEYTVRSLGTTYKDEYRKLVGEGFAKAIPLNDITGFLGGALRGIIMEEKHHELDALNAFLYEECNNNAFCANNPLVNIPATIAIETLNTLARAAAAEELTLTTLPIVAAKGATIGMLAAFLVYTTYLPAHIVKDAAVDYILSDKIPEATLVSSPTVEPDGNEL